MNTRFNPTTNGTGHLGHAYIAILNYHAAKSSGGEFIVRFDDDQEWWVERLGRAKMAEYAEAWKEDLEWLGIVPDRYTSEAEERGSNEALMAAFPLLEIYETVDTEEVNHSYAQIVGWPHSYLDSRHGLADGTLPLRILLPTLGLPHAANALRAAPRLSQVRELQLLRRRRGGGVDRHFQGEGRVQDSRVPRGGMEAGRVGGDAGGGVPGGTGGGLDIRKREREPGALAQT